MYTILSPSKTQDFHRGIILPSSVQRLSTVPQRNEQAMELAKVMKQFSVKGLGDMMKVSPKLAQLTFGRFQDWDGEYGDESIHAPAIVAFLGDVYRGFALEGWGSAEYVYAHTHLGIISGFYGLISPLDYIQAYRLEMGTRIGFSIGGREYKNLYEYWSDILTEKMFQILKEEKTLINLASMEYSKVIDRKILKEKIINEWRGNEQRHTVQIIDIDFKIRKANKKTGETEDKVIAIYAKRARGLMASWIVENTIDTPSDLERFSGDGWAFKSESGVDALGNKRMLFIKTL